ncbi:uncharacterized protein I206_103616 [Kwoniella pini CBS 10737]|uniref:Uncharacterized protein n=1 Tax=Kwoniella pini CBS 10737 TaxID=1296096 RepID=A0A1B9I993_9TREE|nr:uncharacterized protein I206_01381 [Kwoniella pini CBS 10737]OCF52096.1 hypothetical protein I206_01381 [Kwoniella pini CBS 10737]
MSRQDVSENVAENDAGRSTISAEERWLPYDTPRIRHITGIRIHQLTLPESLLYASKLVPSQSHDDVQALPSPSLGESSRRRMSNSSTLSYPFPRRSIEFDKRERSSSTSTARPIEPTSPTVSIHHTQSRNRLTRPRAPTLAGEALEHDHVTSPLDRIESRDNEVQAIKQERKPLRCFVALKFPQKPYPPTISALEEEGDEELRRRTKSDERDLRLNGHNMRKVSRKTSSNSIYTNTNSLPNTPIKPTLRHTISNSSSHSSLLQSTPPRSRTVSLTSPNKPNGNGIDITQGYSLGRSTSRLSDTSSLHSIVRSPPASMRPNMLGKSKASLSISHHFAHAENIPSQTTIKSDNTKDVQGSETNLNDAQENKESLDKQIVRSESKPETEIPFYISPIHTPSTNPRFQGLESNDFANWLTPAQCAQNQFVMEVWIQLPSGEWKLMDGIGGLLDLKELRRGPSTANSNGIEFTLSLNPKETYHVPSTSELESGEESQRGIGVMERSLRETRMKKGVTFGGLHHLINLQAVIADTQRSIEDVRLKVDKLLIADEDWRGLRREISEKRSRIDWFRSKIADVEKLTRETQARSTLKEQDIEIRRNHLDGAEEADELRRGRGRDLEDEIGKIEAERLSLLPQIHLLRAHHVQSLDNLFPIQPLDPSQLLYTILGVPLPIPIGTKDPAPPLTMSEFRVDEKTTAAALGYVALTVQILGNLGGATGGLPYAITCAGSRSSVRDGTGVMQGLRSFPLYSKGVERFRFEYAVFLLNKNIEMLMQESSIRLLDLRHTLPNLKNLLLTLSSPNLPQPPAISRMTSRNVSYRSATPTFIGSNGGWSRTSSSAWGDREREPYTRSMSPGSTQADQSPLKINTLLSPSPLRTIRRSQDNKGKYGSLTRSVDLGSNDDLSESEGEKE